MQGSKGSGCVHGWQGYRCWKDHCESCGPLKAGDNWKKAVVNINAYGGSVRIVTLTPPGRDLLPWSSQSSGLVAEYPARVWNTTASKRAARLFKAASVAADRYLVRMGWKDKPPRVVAVVWAPQRRGVWHVHYVLPNETPAEKLWARTIVSFMDAAWRTESRRWTPNERRDFLLMEYGSGIRDEPVPLAVQEWRSPRGFYGWGFVDRKDAGHGLNHKAAHYIGRNAAGYVAANVRERSSITGRRVRLYVRRELVQATGASIKNLRRVRQLYAVLKNDPASVSELWDSDTLRVVHDLMVGGWEAPARAP